MMRYKQLIGRTLRARTLDRTEVGLPHDLRAVHERSKRAVLDHFTTQIARGIQQGVFRQLSHRS